MDGSNISQTAVPPGGVFTYDFVALQASTFWYHPHFMTNQAIEMGLYGPLVIRERGENNRLGIPQNQELVLMVDDISLEGSQVAPFATRSVSD